MVSPSSDFIRTASQRSSGVGRRSDDEEADGGEDREAVDLWAALESLPTYDRARTTILSEKVLDGSKGEQAAAAEQVDVKDVDVAQYLTTNVFKLNDPPEDNEIFLRKLQTRMERVGVEQPTVEVRYKNLNVVGKIHLGGRALPTLTNSALNFVEGILTSLGIMRSNKRELTILDGVYGILKPGRMTLLLGPPSSGKSTLLTALSGMQDENLKVEGEMQYNGHNLDEFQPRKTSLYVSQDDVHIAELTVRETMDYSARFQGVGQRYELLTEVLRREKEQHILPDPDVDFYIKATAMEDVSHEAVTEYSMRFLGLDICADTAVGDQMTRGISGGQKKRLTTGEMIVGPSKVLFMDEISTGLDSTTAYQVVKCIGQNAHILKSTVLVSLLQPPPETYDLFDDLILMSGGCIVYHGPLEHVEEFFMSCGFQCPARKHVADFLQEVTSFKNQEQYWMHKNEPYRFVPVQHFADAFKNFHVGQELQEELAAPFDKSQSHQSALAQHKYSLSQWDLFKLVLKKEILLMKRNYQLYVFIFGQLFVISFIASTLFFRTLRHHRNLTDASQFSGALFFYLNTITMMGYNEIVFMTLRKKMFHKFRKMYYFPAWTWAVAMFITQIPVSFVGGSLVTFPTYYVVGFAPAAPRFFKAWFLLSLASLMSSGLFRMLGAFCPSSVVAGPVGGLVLMMLFTLSGFIIPRTHMKDWVKWAYWVFPLSYAENGLLANEFLAHQWKKYLPGQAHSLGHEYLSSLGLYDRGFWYWLACGAMVAYALGCYAICAVTLTFIGAAGKSKAVISKQLLEERNRDKTGEGVVSGVPRAALPRSVSSGALALGSPSMRASTGGKSMRSGSLASGRTEALQQEELRSLSGTSHQSLDYMESRAPARGMVMPFQPLSIAFRDINYFVDMPSDRKKESGIEDNRLQLLKGITGVFRPGVLTALVGVTGAGKSTLMDVLSGRKTSGMIEGDIFINGYPKNQETFARIAGYCEQNDIHTAQLTIQESLLFSAWLRLPANVPHDMKKDFVLEMMELVELTSLRRALVGVPGETGLSTEQRKRLTIAVELVANPSIVFMDEPTSGLDARAAATVMRAVRNTVDTGRTVVCTIHQPSIDIFEAFDELLLLKRGGEIIYAGPLGRDSRHLIEYFEKIEGIPKIRNGQNPAAWMLQITAPGMESKLGVDFAELYRHSSVYEQVKAFVQENSVPPPNTEDLSFQTRYAQNRWVQFKCCLWKQHWAYWRNPGYNLARICLALASALYFGTVFWGIGHNPKTQASLFSLLGAVFTSQIFYGILTCVAALPMVTDTRTVFYRERSAGMYDEIPYAFSMVALELPYIMTTSSTFALITYAMIQLKWQADKFFWYLFFLFCSQYTAIIFGMVMVVISPSQQGAQALLNFLFNMWGSFAGFMLPHNKFPVWWTWWYWLQPPSYHIYGTLASQFGDEHDKFVTTREGGRESIPTVLNQGYGFRHSKLGLIAAMSSLFPIVLTAVFILSIKFINYQKR